MSRGNRGSPRCGRCRNQMFGCTGTHRKRTHCKCGWNEHRKRRCSTLDSCNSRIHSSRIHSGHCHLEDMDSGLDVALDMDLGADFPDMVPDEGPDGCSWFQRLDIGFPAHQLELPVVSDPMQATWQRIGFSSFPPKRCHCDYKKSCTREVCRIGAVVFGVRLTKTSSLRSAKPPAACLAGSRHSGT